MKSFVRKDWQLLLSCLVIAVYVLSHLILISTHEAWGDEAQAWNIAKNTTLFGLFPALCAEGHPAGWFLLIKLVQFFGLSFYHFSILSLILMTLSLALVLLKAPFAYPIRLAVSLSSLFCYFNPVICRVYSLSVLIIVLLMLFWNQRKSRPVLYGLLVAILFQTHIVLAGMATSLMILLFIYSFKNKSVLPGALVALFGFLLTVLELFPRSSVEKSVDYSLSSVFSSLSLHSLWESIQALFSSLFTSFPMILGLLLTALLIPLTIYAFMHISSCWEVLLVSFCSAGFILAVNLLIYNINIQASTLFLAIALFILWISFPEINKKEIRCLSVAFLLLFSAGTYHTWIRSARSDYLKDFSESKRMADFICSSLDQDSIIIMKDEELARAAVYAYVTSARPDICFYCPDTDAEYTFFNWSVTTSPLSNEDAVSAAKQHYPDVSSLFLISWKEESENRLSLVFAANEPCEKNDPSWLYSVD